MRLLYLIVLFFPVSLTSLSVSTQPTPSASYYYTSSDEVYEFMNEALGALGRKSGKLYIEERVIGNQIYSNSSQRIFTDKIKSLNVKILDSLLTASDWKFMKRQAENLVIKKWDDTRLNITNTEVLPSSSSRKKKKYHKNGLTLGLSLPFFSEDKQKAILFICRQEPTEGWESILLYQKVAGKWKVISSKLKMWHAQEMK